MIRKFYKKNILRNKNNKFFYYIKSIINDLKPSFFLRSNLALEAIEKEYQEDFSIRSRVDYYNKLDHTINARINSELTIGTYGIPKNIRVYYFDSKYYLKHFSPLFRFHIIPGDVTFIPDEPSIVKSRPVSGENFNSILLNLDKARHFNFLIDDIDFRTKKDVLVGRSGFSQAHRALFYDLYSEHHLCDLKRAVKKSDKGYLNIEGHLKYKYILALEGNDVATNLKWIMSSNSIAVMPRPRYETWFMEGTLLPDVHYICIKNDYSDLEEKLTYYNNNPDLAELIIANAHKYIDKFRNQKTEKTISLLVLKKYFERTNQLCK